MLRQFLGNLKMIGIDPPYAGDSRRGRLEFGRHYGVPSPLIDFSYSPYIAAFFAFSGVRPYESNDADKAAIYCLNVFALAGLWARFCATDYDNTIDSEKFTLRHNDFLQEREEFFEDDVYAQSVLKFLPTPASWNRRMRRQIGCFLYDSLAYPIMDHADLEHFLGEDEVPGTDGATLTKVLLGARYWSAWT
jgi:FRG domain